MGGLSAPGGFEEHMSGMCSGSLNILRVRAGN
jgi:hypothetical protein